MVDVHRTLPSGRSVRLVSDPLDPHAVQLEIDGWAQSRVYAGDPRRLYDDYIERMAAVIDSVAAERSDGRVLHLGVGALTLARQVAVRHPAMRQHLVDSEAGLIDFVLEVLPADALHDVPALTADADDAALALAAEGLRFDIILHDVYVGLTIPPHLIGTEHINHLFDLLDDGGLLVVNIADDRGLPTTRRVAALLTAAFTEVIVDAPTHVIAGATPGNAVLIAARGRRLDAVLPALRSAGPHPAVVAPVDEVLGGSVGTGSMGG